MQHKLSGLFLILLTYKLAGKIFSSSGQSPGRAFLLHPGVGVSKMLKFLR